MSFFPSGQTFLTYLTWDHKNNPDHDVHTITNQICSLSSSCPSLALFCLFSSCIMHGSLTPKQPWRNAAKRGGVSGRGTQRDAKPRRTSGRVCERSSPDILFSIKKRPGWPRGIQFLLSSLATIILHSSLLHAFNLKPKNVWIMYKNFVCVSKWGNVSKASLSQSLNGSHAVSSPECSQLYIGTLPLRSRRFQEWVLKDEDRHVAFAMVNSSHMMAGHDPREET